MLLQLYSMLEKEQGEVKKSVLVFFMSELILKVTLLFLTVKRERNSKV